MSHDSRFPLTHKGLTNVNSVYERGGCGAVEYVYEIDK